MNKDNKYINLGGAYSSPFVYNFEDVEDKYKQCAYLIDKAKNIVFLTGAGISTNAGIPDFRGKEGWYNRKPEYILSMDNFLANPKEVYKFLYTYLKTIRSRKPTKTHNIIKALDDEKNVNIITQNIDNLHIGSNIIHFHGDLEKAHCIKCNKEYSIDYILNDNIDSFNRCECGGLIKPNIILYDENIDKGNLLNSKEICKKADLIIIIGTSLVVQPFASLQLEAPLETPFIILNKTATYLDDNNMSIVINENCDKSLGEIYKRYKNKDF